MSLTCKEFNLYAENPRSSSAHTTLQEYEFEIKGYENKPIAYIMELTVHHEFMSGGGLEVKLLRKDKKELDFFKQYDCLKDNSCLFS